MTHQGTQESGMLPAVDPDLGEPERAEPTAARSGEPTAMDPPPQQGGTTSQAVDHVVGSAQEAAKSVATETATEARAVAQEVSSQVRDLYATGKQEVAGQASAKTEQAAQGLRRLSDQVGALAEGRPNEAGPLADYTREAQARLTQFAGRLEDGGPQGILDDATRFARRRPLIFIGACAGAGFLLTRFLRASAGTGQDDQHRGLQPPSTNAGVVPVASGPSALTVESAPMASQVGDRSTQGQVAR